MNKDLITIIIPVYNVEKYLKKCLDSIINQTYKNLEIILIDDGSIDNSPKICDEYAIKDKRIKVIHKRNAGVSSARNDGLNKATGQYLIFVDSDDYIELNMVEKIYNNTKKYNTDLYLFNYYTIENKVKRKGSTLKTPSKNLTKKEFYNYLFSNQYYCGYICNKLFKTSTIGKIRFQKDVHLLEDLLFISQVAENCNNFYYDYDEYLYNYVIREESALNSKFNLKQLSSITVRDKVMKYAIKYNCTTIKVLKFNLLWDSIYYKYQLKKYYPEQKNNINTKKYALY